MKAVLERNLGFLGYPNYSVDTDGNVWSLKYKKTKQTKKLKWWMNENGYCCVHLFKKCKGKCFKVHRLVALAFLPNIENKNDVDHINTIKTDNRLSNLRWATRSENNLNPITNKRSRNKRGKVVLQYTKDLVFVSEYISTMDAQRSTGIANPNISACCLGKAKTAGGYIWRYKKEDD